MTLSILALIPPYPPFHSSELKHSLQQYLNDDKVISASVLYSWTLYTPHRVTLFLQLLLPRGFLSGFF